MSKSRIIKARRAVVATKDQFLATVDAAAEAIVQYHRLEAEAQKAHQDVDANYGTQLADLAARVQTLADSAEPYFLAHRDELCNAGQREGESPLAVFGIRLGKPTVVKTVKATFEALAGQFAANNFLSRFVRTKREIDKKAVLDFFRDETDKGLVDAARKAGLDVEQREEFWLKAKAENQV